jgi:hypothetical protein
MHHSWGELETQHFGWKTSKEETSWGPKYRWEGTVKVDLRETLHAADNYRV